MSLNLRFMHSPPILKTALNFGALCGLGTFIVFLALYYSGINTLVASSWHAAWVPLIFMVLSVRYYRFSENRGFVSYWQAFRTSFFTAAAGALVFSGFIWIFGSYIDGNVLEQYKQQSLEAIELTEGMMKSMVGENAYDQYVEDISQISMSEVAIQDFNNKVFGGLLLSFIVAAFLRKDPPLPGEE